MNFGRGGRDKKLTSSRAPHTHLLWFMAAALGGFAPSIADADDLSLLGKFNGYKPSGGSGIVLVDNSAIKLLPDGVVEISTYTLYQHAAQSNGQMVVATNDIFRIDCKTSQWVPMRTDLYNSEGASIRSITVEARFSPIADGTPIKAAKGLACEQADPRRYPKMPPQATVRALIIDAAAGRLNF